MKSDPSDSEHSPYTRVILFRAPWRRATNGLSVRRFRANQARAASASSDNFNFHDDNFRCKGRVKLRSREEGSWSQDRDGRDPCSSECPTLTPPPQCRNAAAADDPRECEVEEKGLSDLPGRSAPFCESSDSDHVTADEYRVLFRKKRALRDRDAKARHVRTRACEDSEAKVEGAGSECTCERDSPAISHSEL